MRRLAWALLVVLLWGVGAMGATDTFSYGDVRITPLSGNIFRCEGTVTNQSDQFYQGACFNLFILAMLALDLGVFHWRAHVVSLREAATWTAVWIALALLFAGGIWHFLGPQKGMEFLTGYLIEKSLSVDNIFVFVVLFGYFAVPRAYQHRVLFWGILGALVLRAAFIFAGTALLTRFHWVIYLFGAFLVVTGVKMVLAPDRGLEPEKNPVPVTVSKAAA